LTEPDGSLRRIHGTVREPGDPYLASSHPLHIRLREGRPIRMPVAEIPRPSVRAELEQDRVRALVLVPLLLAGRFMGLITASRRDADGLVELADDLLLAVGRIASAAFEQTRLLAAARARTERDRLLREAARFAASSQDLDAVVGRYAETMARLI